MSLRYRLDTSVVSSPISKQPNDEIVRRLAVHWHGHERARLDALGRPAPYVDGQIAAIARVNGLLLVTITVQDFARFKGLGVEDWSKRSR